MPQPEHVVGRKRKTACIERTYKSRDYDRISRGGPELLKSEELIANPANSYELGVCGHPFELAAKPRDIRIYCAFV